MSRFLVLSLGQLVLILWLLSDDATAQLSKWQPKVGDEFTYVIDGSGISTGQGNVLDQWSRSDTMKMTVQSISKNHIVVKDEYRDSITSTWFDISKSDSVGVKYPFIVATNQWEGPWFGTSLIRPVDYFNAIEKSYPFKSGSFLTAVKSDNQESAVYNIISDTESVVAQSRRVFTTLTYSPDLHWFVKIESVDSSMNIGDDTQRHQHWSMVLLSYQLKENAAVSVVNSVISEPRVVLSGANLKVESTSRIRRIELFDCLGRALRDFEGNDMFAVTLDISNVPPGAYFVKIESGKVIRVKPVSIVN